MRSVVLGAGIAGVTAAYELARRGHEVTVVDRQPGAALETSFANGGLVVPSQSDPWASPDAPMKLLKWLGREEEAHRLARGGYSGYMESRHQEVQRRRRRGRLALPQYAR